jgi:Fe-S cluster biogenesis protein NfuA
MTLNPIDKDTCSSADISSGSSLGFNESKNEKNVSLPTEELIQMILQMRIRPVLQAHGGDISFIDFKDGVIFVRLSGSCDGCPHALETMKNNVEGFLKVLVPQVKAVRDINGNDQEN